jgi:hypothetical protein
LLPTPTAFVLLRSDQGPRNRAFCLGFRTLPTNNELSAASPYVLTTISTRWLTRRTDASMSDIRDCSYLLDNYDFERAAELRGALGAASATARARLTGVGPQVVQVLPDGRVVVIDGSSRDLGALRQFAQAWLLLADEPDAAPPRPGGTAPAQGGGTACEPPARDASWMTVLSGTALCALRTRFPEAVVIAEGARVLACSVADRRLGRLCPPPD